MAVGAGSALPFYSVLVAAAGVQLSKSGLVLLN